MKSTRLILLIGATILAQSYSAVAQANPWIAFVERITKDALCNARNVPGMAEGRPAPTNQDQRFTLYLRCEAKGGRDGLVRNSCCEHLSSNDAKNIGVCPDNPVDVIVPVRDAFKAFVQC